MTYQEKQKQKAYYIPIVAEGKLSIRKAAKILNITSQAVFILKHRYIKHGEKAFINGHKGMKYQKKKYSDPFRERVIELYSDQWKDAPFSTFCDSLNKYHDISIKYNALRKILLKAGFKPPRSWTTREKQEHKPRDEREREGELVQMDGSCHDWFMNGQYETIHGGIDDATHKITGLYMCLNECRLGYNEVLRQTWTRYGLPLAYYIDRHSSFVKSKNKARLLSSSIEYAKNESTHFKDLCDELTIEVILALSPQGKGRIERLWQTLQGKLPYIFRFLKIDTIEAANAFLSDWVDSFNARFSVPARSSHRAWRKLPEWFDFDYKLSVKFTCRTDSRGYFTFHECDFRLIAPARSFRHFELCLSEKFGIRAYMSGKWYDVELAEGKLQDCRGDRMPIVEKDLIGRFLLKDIHSEYA